MNKKNGTPKLSEKETLELARMDLKTAMHRQEEALRLFKSVEGLIQWEVSMSILTKIEKLLNGASFEIQRAGKTLK